MLDKLLEFHHEHGAPPHEILRDLKHAANQIPWPELAAEAVPLRNACQRACRKDRQPIRLIVKAC